MFIPRINSSLLDFQAAWNQHALSSENNLSPLQLYTAYAQGSELFDEVVTPNSHMHVQDTDTSDGSSDEDNDVTRVVIPLTHIPLSSNSLQQLRNSINTDEECSDLENNYILILYS